jgi:hypothetical protein
MQSFFWIIAWYAPRSQKWGVYNTPIFHDAYGFGIDYFLRKFLDFLYLDIL